jgi:hypothetical protein
MANDRGRRLPAYVVFRTQRISGGREPTLGRSARRPRGRPASPDPGRPFCFAKPCVTKPCVTKPCVTKPCVTKPCVTKPCVTKPCVAKPCVAKPCLASVVWPSLVWPALSGQPCPAKPQASISIIRAPAPCARHSAWACQPAVPLWRAYIVPATARPEARRTVSISPVSIP